MHSLDTNLLRNKESVYLRLVKRSGWAILVVVVVILIIALIPYGEPATSSSAAQPSQNDAKKLRHILLLHRHGVLRGFLRLPGLSSLRELCNSWCFGEIASLCTTPVRWLQACDFQRIAMVPCYPY
jgi:hypothetical protein